MGNTKTVDQAALGKMARDALAVQNACNMSGVAISFGKVVPELRSLLGSWDVSEHPIVQLWVCKLYEMSGIGIADMVRYNNAYDNVRIMAGEEL